MTGRYNPSVRRRLWATRPHVCFYCDIPLRWERSWSDSATVEHIRPYSKGGSDASFNTELACKECNAARGNRDVSKINKRLRELWNEFERLSRIHVKLLKEDWPKRDGQQRYARPAQVLISDNQPGACG